MERSNSSYPARYLNLFCAAMVKFPQGQVKVSLYMWILGLHRSWLQPAELKYCIISIEVYKKKVQQSS